MWRFVASPSAAKPLAAELGLTATSTDVLYNGLEDASGRRLQQGGDGLSAPMTLPSLFPSRFPVSVSPYMPPPPRLSNEQKPIYAATEGGGGESDLGKRSHEDERVHKIRIVEKLGSVHNAMSTTDPQQVLAMVVIYRQSLSACSDPFSFIRTDQSCLLNVLW